MSYKHLIEGISEAHRRHIGGNACLIPSFLFSLFLSPASNAGFNNVHCAGYYPAFT